jgi:hypothetical protein
LAVEEYLGEGDAQGQDGVAEFPGALKDAGAGIEIVEDLDGILAGAAQQFVIRQSFASGVASSRRKRSRCSSPTPSSSRGTGADW